MFTYDLQVGTLTRYLLDEVCKYEHGFGDMLMPSRSHERHVTFMGGPQAADKHVGGAAQSDSNVRKVLDELCQQQRRLESMIVQLSTHLHVSTLSPSSMFHDVSV